MAPLLLHSHERLVYDGIWSIVQVGGLSFKTQEVALSRAPDVIVATPARLIDHLMNAHSFGLDTVCFACLNEAPAEDFV